MRRWLLCAGAATVAACHWLAPLPNERFDEETTDAGRPSAGDGDQNGGGTPPSNGGVGFMQDAGANGAGAPSELLGGAGFGGQAQTIGIPGSPKSTLPIVVASLDRTPLGDPLPELELIWTTANGVHHLSRQGGQFGAAANLGGAPALPPVALATRIARLDLFIAEASGTVRHRQLEDGAWSPRSTWDELEGTAKRSLSVTGDREHMDVFAVDDDGSVWHRHWVRDDSGGAWGDWSELEGATADGGVAATSPRPGIVEAVLRQNGRLFTRVFDAAGWDPNWSRVGDEVCTGGAESACPCLNLVTDPEIISIDIGRVDIVFDSGSLFHLWHAANLQWHCEPLDQAPTGRHPALLSRELGRLDVLLPGEDSVFLRAWSGAAWSEWSALSANFRDLAATSPNPSSMFVVGRTADDTIEYLEWGVDSGWLR